MWLKVTISLSRDKGKASRLRIALLARFGHATQFFQIALSPHQEAQKITKLVNNLYETQMLLRATPN